MKSKMIYEAAQELRKTADRLEIEARKEEIKEAQDISKILGYLIEIDELKKQIESRRKQK
jgi:hypothetical protein